MFKEQFFYYFNLLKGSFSLFFFNLINFGFKLAFFNFMGDIAQFYLFKKYNFSQKLMRKQQDCVYNTLTSRFSNFIEEYKSKDIEIRPNSRKIWCFWWQGVQNAPDIVKNCVNSIEKYSGDYELVVLTKDNYDKYLDIPNDIIKKVEDGKISLTNLSDIIRLGLLSKYGGVWVDVTMFFSDHVFNEFDDIIFNSCFRGEGSWSSFFMGGKSNKLFSFAYNFLIRYAREYDKFINYFLLNYTIEIACDYFEECREYMDGCYLENPNIFYFIDNFSKSFDEEEFNELCEKYKFFKLSYKPTKNLSDLDKEGNLTYWGYFRKILE